MARIDSGNSEDFSADYKQGYKDGWDAVEKFIREAVETYETTIFICQDCDKPAYMIDPGDGLVTHLE